RSSPHRVPTLFPYTTLFRSQMIQILHREVAQGSRIAAQLYDEIMAYPDLPSEWRLPRNAARSSPVMTIQLRKGELRLAFFSTFTDRKSTRLNSSHVSISYAV